MIPDLIRGCTHVTVACMIATGCSRSSVDLSPASWPEGEWDRFTELEEVPGTPRPSGRGTQGIIAGTSGALAVHAGLKALEQGGSAADAVMTTVLAQVANHMGGATSYAGQLSMMYFEAATGEVHSMNAGYATLLEEDDPLSIPTYGTPSGRAVMVPGFMAGVEAASERFGKLPFAQLFEPAIYIAERGFNLTASRAGWLRQREHVITRLPEGREIFTGEDGELYSEGDHFRQPQAAATLRRVAAEGAGYMYEGAWGQKLVEAVRREGGKMTMQDLENYEVIWTRPRHTTFRDYEIYGGANLLEAMNILELADLPSWGHPSTSAESLYWLIQISRVAELMGPQLVGTRVPPEVVEKHVPGIDLSLESRVTKEHARLVWDAMREPRWKALRQVARKIQMGDAELIANLVRDFRRRPPTRPDHTAGVIAVDAEGNMAAVVHSVTSAVWGEVGIFVDGISVTDPGGFAQHWMAEVGPGAHLGAGGGGGACPVIVVKQGKPFLGCGSVGAAFYEVTLQSILNVLEFGMNPKEAFASPQFRKNWPPNLPLRQPLGPREFPEALLKAVQQMGVDLEIVRDPTLASHRGTWVGVMVDPATGEMLGNRLAEGH